MLNSTSPRSWSFRRSILVSMIAVLTPSCSSSDASAPSSTGDAGSDTAADGSSDAALEGSVDSSPDSSPPLTAADIEFEAVNPMPAGEQLVFNDWSATPDQLVSMTPDGKTATTVFRAYRIWSFGVSRAGDRIAFSCADPKQEEHYGVTFSDSIQHTWLFDAAKQLVEPLAVGNLNDECHTFGPGDLALYVCRRYDFQADGQFKGWRIGRIDPVTKAFLFLTDDLTNTYDISPQPLPDGQSMLFERIQITPPSSQQNTVMQLPLPNGVPAVLRSDAGRPMLSPDGTHYVFRNTKDGATLYSSKLDGSETVKVTNARGTQAVWSPDGTRVAYLIYDDKAACSHIDVVAADGTQAGAPTRLRDCSKSGEFISQLSWVLRP